jgi:hypothetical protein
VLRDAQVKQARAAGQGELVSRLKRLRKPTVAAWLVNQVSRAHPKDVERLATVGAALRAAHHALAGERLRDLSRERNELIQTLTGHARAIARAAGHQVGDTTLDQLENTWTAAVTDDAAAQAVRTGQLSAALQPAAAQDWLTAATGSPSPAPARSKPAAPPPSDGDDDSRDDGRAAEAEAKQAALHQGRQEAQRQARARDKARHTLATAEQAATDAAAVADDLRQQLAALETRVKNAAERERTSKERVTAAREAATVAEQAADKAEQHLSELEADDD